MATTDQELDFSIDRLGTCRFPSPLQGVRYTTDDERLLFQSRFTELQPYLAAAGGPPTLELAGPRERLRTLNWSPARSAAHG